MKINNQKTIHYKAITGIEYVIFQVKHNSYYFTYTIQGRKMGDTLQGLKNLLDNLK